ncbi:flagellar basal body L-ring protein FlgH [Palleronia sp. KMU-117]|uniref:flagellar basal body L-ring protein FlgH n=1 Tax=Palleronia sp. KMU-117 TaxID=3434108 RepID=UPI003D71C055
MKFRSLSALLIASTLASGCSRLGDVGRAPGLTPVDDSLEVRAMATPGFPVALDSSQRADRASLWSGTRSSLLGDRRANLRGDILTVVVEIDDSAEISNSTSRSRAGSEGMGIDALFGIPQRLNDRLPEGASMGDAVRLDSTSRSRGDGSVSRNEQLELRVAATVVDVLNNGVLKIQGSQEVRVNFEIRELIVTGFVRPEDISRQNEITYDKIASARISYGGRGQISDVQQPRYGQQIADIVLPF